MRRHLLCRLGLHKDRRMSVDGGPVFGRCQRCGRDRDKSSVITLYGQIPGAG